MTTPAAETVQALMPALRENLARLVWKLGLPLAVLFGVVAVLLVPVIWSF